MMHEVVKRLKAMISQSNIVVTYQQNNNVSDQIGEKPTLISIGTSSRGELSQLVEKFPYMNTNE